MKNTVNTVAMKLDGGTVRPGDAVLVLTDRHRGAAGRFHGKFRDGKLAIAVNFGGFQTYLHLLPTQVRRLEPTKGART